MSLFVTIKSALRRAIAPVARPVLRRLRPRMARLSEPYRLSAAWQQLAPALTNAAASVGAVAREQARMKREYDAAFAELKSEIARLREPGEQRVAGPRVNLGGTPKPGYVNIATQQAPGVDIVAPFDALPFGAGELGEIRVDDLASFPEEELRQKLLPHWMRLLKPGGTLRASK